MEDLNAILASFDIQDNIYDRLYSILGCGPHHTLQQITYEYKQLALKYHPDRHPNDSIAEKKFQEIKLAHDILCDPKEREHYDYWLNSSLQVPYPLWRKTRLMTHWTHATSLPSIQDSETASLTRHHTSQSNFLEKFRNYEI